MSNDEISLKLVKSFDARSDADLSLADMKWLRSNIKAALDEKDEYYTEGLTNRMQMINALNKRIVESEK